jgi:hypothetical protein
MAPIPQLIGDVRFGKKSYFGGKLTVFEARQVLLCLKPPGIDI